MKHSTALIIPNFRWQKADAHVFWYVIPHNMCLIASTIRDLCDIHIIDANTEKYSTGDVKRILTKLQPDVVGITVMMDQFAQSGHLTAKIVREALPNATIIMGGVYPTVNPDLAVIDSNLDYIFMGEAEEGFRDFLLYLWHDKPFPNRGLGYIDKQGAIHIQEKAKAISDLNTLTPAYDLIDFKKYTMNAPRKSVDGPALFPFARIQTSRGCPQNCCFCQVKMISGNRFRPRSPEHILDEIAFLKHTYAIRSLIFDDDNIVTQRSRAMKLFQGMIDRGLAMPWKAIAMAVFRLDEELIALMAKSGCQYFSIAVESGSPRILKEVIQKPVDLEYARKMVAYAKTCGIYVSTNFIIGFPTETWDEIRQTLRYAEELNTDYVKIFTAIPLRHTKLWEMCEKGGYFKDNFSIQDISWNEGQIVSPHFNPSELAFLRAYEWDRINFSTTEKIAKTAQMMQISEEELAQIRIDTRNNALRIIKTSK